MLRGGVRIGEWLLDGRTHRLSHGAQSHRLPRIQFDLLCCLCAHAGQLVSRETLIEQVWKRKVVSDEVLSRQIAVLRRLFGDDARAPRYLETVPKAGYRLLAEVSEIGQVGEDPAAGRPADPDFDAHRHNALLRMGLLAMVVAMVCGLAAILERSAASRLHWTAASMAREIPLATDPDLEMAPRMSRDGRWLAYARTSGEGESSLWLARADGGGPQQLTRVTGSISGIAFAPDAATLAFIEQDGKRCRVRAFPLPAGPPTVLADCAFGRGLDWTPDGRVT